MHISGQDSTRILRSSQRISSHPGVTGCASRDSPWYPTGVVQPPAEPWTVVRDGVEIYAASPQHVALVTRTLGVDEACWRRALLGYSERCRDASSVDQRLQALTDSWNECSPHKAALPELGSSTCPICDGCVTPWLAKRSPSLAYGRCAGCGHAVLLAGAAEDGIYTAGRYFQQVDPATSAGYRAYEAERAYREGKGASLLAWIEVESHQRPQTLLEVGSGYGYTRQAAESMGMVSAGVDPNPHAAEQSRRLYGFETYVGDLKSAIDAELAREGWFDLVLYQFVLEHLRDPAAELGQAARAARPGGLIALVVPSADARELDVFASSYRSMRADHLHLFSRRSIELGALRAGLQPIASRTECNIHLLRGILSAEELDRHVYLPGRGPDLLFLARRPR